MCARSPVAAISRIVAVTARSGRVTVRADLRVEGEDGVVEGAWAAGDNAAVPDLSGGGVGGYWGYPSSTVLAENGVNAPMDEYGQLKNVADASKVAPMQPWALGVYQNRQKRLLKDDPTFINCKPPGGPRMYQSDLGIQFVEDVARKRIFVMMGSGNHNYRIIYLDGREQKGLVGGDDDNPLYFGRAVAGNQHHAACLKFRGSIQHMAQQSTPGQSVQHLGQSAFHARTLAGGHDHHINRHGFVGRC